MQIWKFISAILLMALVGLPPHALHAADVDDKDLPLAEIIHRYDVDIHILPDSSLRIVETIEVTALGDQIKRGIYREFPVLTQAVLGLRLRHKLDVVRATRDGQTEKFRVEDPDENRPNDARIYLGQKNKPLTKGKYLYTIEYVTDDWLHHDEAEDELYWNVTGNFWNFPIEKSSVTIYLPGKFEPDQITVDAWTGAAGEKKQDWRQLDAAAGEVKLETTTVLGAKEGWTVSVKFPSGAVVFPTASEWYGQLLEDNPDMLLTLLTLCCALGAYTVGWIMVGRDPAPGAILVQDDPPANISPAAARYVSRMGFDSECLASALVYAASKGVVSLSCDKSGNYSIHKVDEARFSELPADVEALLRGLLEDRKQLTFTKSVHQIVSAAVNDFKSVLAKSYRGTYFLVNGWWTFWGISISLVGMIMAILSSPNYQLGLFFSVWLSIWTVGVFMLGTMVLTTWKLLLFGPGGPVQRGLALGGAIFITAFATPFFIAEVVVLGIFASQVSYYIPFGVLLLVIMAWRFYHWMKRPTHEGRQMLDQLAGYRMWLEGEFVRKVQYAASPEQGAMMYDDRLPWAMAFDMQDGWYEQLGKKVLESSEFYTGLNHNSPHSGRPFGNQMVGPMLTGAALAGALGGAISSASVSPSSKGSGGSSGGGSSGGGGGGGGGGGW